MSEGFLEDVGRLLHQRSSSSAVITHGCQIITDLCGASTAEQVNPVLRVLLFYPGMDKLNPIDVTRGCGGESVLARTPPGAGVSSRVR